MTKKKTEPGIVEARVQELMNVMSLQLWDKGKSAKVYAKKWGLTEQRVWELSAEAWRRVCAASDDAEEVRPKLAGGLYAIFETARERGQFDPAIKAADVLSKITGARAAERHEYAHVVAQYDSLDNAAKLAYLRNLIKEAQEAIAAIETIDVKGELTG